MSRISDFFAPKPHKPAPAPKQPPSPPPPTSAEPAGGGSGSSGPDPVYTPSEPSAPNTYSPATTPSAGGPDGTGSAPSATSTPSADQPRGTATRTSVPRGPTLRDTYAEATQSSAVRSRSLIEIERIADTRRTAEAADTTLTTADIIAQASSTLVAQTASRDAVLALLKQG